MAERGSTGDRRPSGAEPHGGGPQKKSGDRQGTSSAVWPVVAAVTCSVLAAAALLGTALMSGDAEVERLLGGAQAPGVGAQLLGMALGLVLSLGVLLFALTASRKNPSGGRRVLGAAAIGLGGLAAILTAVTGAQFALLTTVAEAAPTAAATIPWPGMVGLAVVLLVVGCVASTVLALRPRHAPPQDRATAKDRGATGDGPARPGDRTP